MQMPMASGNGMPLPAGGNTSNMTHKDKIGHNVTQQTFTKYMSPYHKGVKKGTVNNAHLR